MNLTSINRYFTGGIAMNDLEAANKKLELLVEKKDGLLLRIKDD